MKLTCYISSYFLFYMSETVSEWINFLSRTQQHKFTPKYNIEQRIISVREIKCNLDFIHCSAILPIDSYELDRLIRQNATQASNDFASETKVRSFNAV